MHLKTQKPQIEAFVLAILMLCHLTSGLIPFDI